MENYINNSVPMPAYILCLGLGWFPKTPGGLDRYVYEQVHTLAQMQNQVELCGLGLPQYQFNTPVKLTNLALPDSPLWQRIVSTRRTFSQRQAPLPDAINLHFALYSLPILDLLPKNVPITFTFHGPWALESQQEGGSKLEVFLKKWLVEKQVYSRCDRFIVLSRAFGNILHQEYQVPWDKINIIPGGVDINRFQANLSRQEARNQLDWPQNRAILFTTRRLVHRMGIDKLLMAIAKVKHKIPDVWLAIAGKGLLKDSLEQQAQELGLSNHVKFLGFLPDHQLPIAYQAADLTIMPSQSLEGFGLAVIESLACGTPAMCTPVGGMPEILKPFSPDLVTDSRDTNEIAERLEHLLSGKLAVPSRVACREYAATRFNWPKIATQINQVLLYGKNTDNVVAPTLIEQT